MRTILSLNAVQAVIDKFVAATEKAYQEAIKVLHISLDLLTERCMLPFSLDIWSSYCLDRISCTPMCDRVIAIHRGQYRRILPVIRMLRVSWEH